ncbi:hypothetical protein [Schaalia vaccimaxillae]|uniref:hypothetical protein n=1 Tax=Schaalia vaccimaxillae TaxID=183916 RepID=UPI0013F3E844|nr:hypothetical protein [Schaalia vaccimaxillae]
MSRTPASNESEPKQKDSTSASSNNLAERLARLVGWMFFIAAPVFFLAAYAVFGHRS